MDNHQHDSTVITVSALRKYQECHRKYKLAHIDLFDMESDFENRLIGHTYHKCLERAYNLQGFEDILLEFQDTIPFPSENKMTSILRGMLSARFVLELDNTLPIFPVIECEKELTLDINGITWAGKIDRIEEHDGLWVVDTKTRNGKYKLIPEIYNHSMQLVMYTIMARHHGYNVKGYIVDCCRIPILKELNNWNAYVKKIHEDIISRHNDYFARFKYPVDDQLVEKVFQNVRYWVNEIKTDTQFSQDFSQCIDYRYGYTCEFYPVCWENADINLINRKPKSHTELETI